MAQQNPVTDMMKVAPPTLDTTNVAAMQNVNMKRENAHSVAR
jgi:hypothetical protein